MFVVFTNTEYTKHYACICDLRVDPQVLPADRGFTRAVSGSKVTALERFIGVLPMAGGLSLLATVLEKASAQDLSSP